MTGDEKSSGNAGLFDDDDPFDINVKVVLPHAQAQSPTGDGKDSQEDKSDDKGDKREEREEPEDKNRREADAEEEGVGGEQDEEGEGEEGGGRRNLRASRRHAKRLSRQLGRNAIYVSQLEARVGHLEKMNVNLLKSQMSSQIGSYRSELARLRSERAAARSANDSNAENAAEDAIGKTTAEIARLESGMKELDDYKPPAAQNPMLADWMDRNSDWYEKPGYERETAAAKQASIDAARHGIHQFDPRHYSQINDAVGKINAKIMSDDDDDAVAGEEEAEDKGRKQPLQRREQRRGPVVTGGGRKVPGGGGPKGPVVPKALMDAWRQAGFNVTTKEEQQEMYDRYMETQGRLGLLKK